MTNKSKVKRDIYSEITNKVIELMKTEGMNWTKPWSTNLLETGSPINIVTNNHYQGINVFNLAMDSALAGYNSNIWGTFKQWSDKGYKIKKGAKSSIIVFFKQITKEDKNDADNIISFPVLKYFAVFNACQIVDFDIPASPIEKPSIDLDAACDIFFTNTKSRLKLGGDKAYYSPSLDYIRLPNVKDFKTTQGYYNTLFHELGHWTGNANRLDRKFGHSFGNQDYAFEELIAELASTYICAQLGLEKTPCPNHAKYLAGWLTKLKTDKRAFFKAAAQAQKAADYMNSLQDTDKAIAA